MSYEPGWQGEMDGLPIRIVGGKKPDTNGVFGKDHRLDIWTPNGWKPISMNLVGFLFWCLYMNEDRLYPPPAQGGKKLLRFLKDCVDCGPDKAQAGLRLERRFKRRSPQLFESEVT